MAEERLEVLMSEKRTFPPSDEFRSKAHIGSLADYEALYKRAADDTEGFWSEMAESQLTWFKKWDRVLEWDFMKPEVKWFIGGKINACYNCLDRFMHTPTQNKAAIIWESDSGEYRTFTYQQLYREVNRFANVLKRFNVGKGDRVTIYMPMIPELVVAMLTCARIGAIHSIVFGGFSAQALRDRINDCTAKLVITADRGVRGGRYIRLKANADMALEECPTVEHMIVVKRTIDVDMEPKRDFWWHDLMHDTDIADYCEPEWMDAEDPLFILYTSGSTGKPKGVIHTTGGYMTQAYWTTKWDFDLHDEDVFWCTSDIGWVTGHTYNVYGPLSVGATQIFYEGAPDYPDRGRVWEIMEQHGVTVFYTAPTLIRMFMGWGNEWLEKHDLGTLRLLATVGEPISRDAWMWYFERVGGGRCPVIDTWWQTETGGHVDQPARRRHDAQARLRRSSLLRRAHQGAHRQGRRGRRGRVRPSRHHPSVARHDPRHVGRRRGQAVQGSLLHDVPRRVHDG